MFSRSRSSGSIFVTGSLISGLLVVPFIRHVIGCKPFRSRVKQKEESIALAYMATGHMIEDTKASAQHVTMRSLLQHALPSAWLYILVPCCTPAFDHEGSVGANSSDKHGMTANDWGYNKVNTMHDCKKVSYAYRMLICTTAASQVHDRGLIKRCLRRGDTFMMPITSEAPYVGLRSQSGISTWIMPSWHEIVGGLELVVHVFGGSFDRHGIDGCQGLVTLAEEIVRRVDVAACLP